MAKIVEGLGHGAGFAKRRPAALLNSLPLFLLSFLHRYCRDAFNSGSCPGGGLNAELAERPHRRPPPTWGRCREVGRSASTARRRLHAYLAVGPAPKTSTDPVPPATSAHGGCGCEFGRSASTAGDEHGSHSDRDLDSRGAAAAREVGLHRSSAFAYLSTGLAAETSEAPAATAAGDTCGQRGEQQGPSRGALSPRHHKHTIVVHPSAGGVDAHPAARCNLPMRRERWWPWRNSWAPSSHHLDCRRALCPLLWPPIVLTVCFPVPPTCLTKCILHIDKILCIEHQQSATCIHL
ncbi:hypothetical protein PAHAL_6G064500 [Panicum hallii]|uniref:Uncharacterized protein n=1 Tax=Panicum hallii TaxID=206008 RepID=A0A2T8IFE3_9POAL|nr:hypothetical protein PAHAL_6G064500 [Panicum hallii]